MFFQSDLDSTLQPMNSSSRRDCPADAGVPAGCGPSQITLRVWGRRSRSARLEICAQHARPVPTATGLSTRFPGFSKCRLGVSFVPPRPPNLRCREKPMDPVFHGRYAPLTGTDPPPDRGSKSGPARLGVLLEPCGFHSCDFSGCLKIQNAAQVRSGAEHWSVRCRGSPCQSSATSHRAPGRSERSDDSSG